MDQKKKIRPVMRESPCGCVRRVWKTGHIRIVRLCLYAADLCHYRDFAEPDSPRRKAFASMLEEHFKEGEMDV